MELERVGACSARHFGCWELLCLGTEHGKNIFASCDVTLSFVESDVAWSFFAPEGPFSGHMSRGM